METEEQRFGPSQHGQRSLALIMALAAIAFLYFGWVMWPDFPEVRRSHGYVFLLAGVCLACAVAAYRWKRFQAEIVVSKEGVAFHATGGAPVPRTVLAWQDIARIEHRVEVRPRAHDLRFLVFVAGPQAASPGRAYRIINEGLDTGFATVIDTIGAFASHGGWRLAGPRPRHVGNWFDGMHWRLERVSDTGNG